MIAVHDKILFGSQFCHDRKRKRMSGLYMSLEPRNKNIGIKY